MRDLHLETPGCEILIEDHDGQSVVTIKRCGKVVIESFSQPYIEKIIKEKPRETKEAEKPEVKEKDLEALEEQALKKLKKREVKDGGAKQG